ncbi:MAG: NAD(P)/FAD-dependent oxidoreductase [Acidobacteriota bacterium]
MTVAGEFRDAPVHLVTTWKETSMASEAPLDCLIIGAGPAGLTAALYLKRFHRHVRVVDAGRSRALRIPRSWNLPGFPGGIGGQAFLARLREQLAHLGCEVDSDEVTALSRHPEGGFEVRSAQRQWPARTVVLATGSRDKEADLPGLPELRDAGLLRECPICDAHEFSNQRIGVIGWSAHAAREALFLRHYSERVELLALRTPDDVAPDWLGDLDQRKVTWDATGMTRIHHRDRAVHVTLADGSEKVFDVLYAALGCHPASDLAHALKARCDPIGNLAIDAHCHTGVPGLYAAGDVTAGLDQVVVALAQGAIAATAIHNELCGANR